MDDNTGSDLAAPAVEVEQTAPVEGSKVTINDAPAVDFSIPDEYKEKGWSDKVKSTEDMWKQLDNLNSAVGKKNDMPDFENGTPEDVEKFLSKYRPESKDVYKFGDAGDEGISSQVADLLYENGITAHQGNKIIDAYQKIELTSLEAATSADGFKEIMTATVGDGYEKLVGNVSNDLKKFLNEDTNNVLNGMPNKYLSAMYQLADAYRSNYGIKESGAQVEGGAGGFSPVNMGEKRSSIRQAIQKLEGRPHTAQEKQVLLDSLSATYK